MKTVSGEVVSCKTVSLSKASRILSKFACLDNGAAPAFALYVRRASAAFDELAQLHKELKISGGERKAKKRHSDGIVAHGTVESGVAGSEDGLLGKEIGTSKSKEHRGVSKSKGEAGRVEASLDNDEGTQKHKSKNKRDKDDEGRRNAGRSSMSMEGKKVEEIVDGNVDDVGSAEKKSKKKKANKGNVDEVMKIVENNGHDQKQHKKKKEIKEERVSNGIKVDEQRNESKGDHRNLRTVDKGGKDKKHKKKRTREGEDEENEGKLAIEVASNKVSKKRKHESVANGALDDLQEEHKSKKKRR